MYKYYNKDIPNEINVIYGTRESGKTYRELANKLTPDELRCFEHMKEMIKNCNIKRTDFIIRVLLTDRYDEFVEYIRKGEQNEYRN